MRGKFITFEGSEGCGKSTQSHLLYQYLKRKGRNVLYLREPGGTKISEKIRNILLDAKNLSMSPVCETLLYMAARAQIVDEVIAPALKKGKIVICDRFLDSTLAYQGYGLGINIKDINYIGRFSTSGIMPGLTVFLDFPLKACLKRRAGSKDRIERRSFGYHARVRKGYLKLAQKYPGRFKVVRVDHDKRMTQGAIRELADKFLREH